MIADALRELFVRDISRLRDEMSLYSNDEELWRITPDIKNSAGTIALHLIGNLNHWICNLIGGSGYVRDRDSEFTKRDVPLTEILNSIDNTLIEVKRALAILKEEDLGKIYPTDILERDVTTGLFLIYVNGHLNYHLGQINYHRRLTHEPAAVN